ncbi:hypothetical protein PR202_gb06970 [Eleusine coracana subsp. coracana]|uniref:FAS1 domain-containing protein n=1 Tax=Eleusine coracana subsp. coracana TaxID=191504 RepID=A0AAV5EAR0_ELECO|nr:hypothetical protein QOZ80_2BG0164270 [Eleusine coracana subsp. coracana]GJN19670.1 hypothetical protein PR202_gb06970 [Eleusine coracana subsp. coracana]
MASHTLLPLLLLPFLFAAATAADIDIAQGPTPPEEATTNLTSILAKGEQYTTLLRLLNSTGVDEQLAIQLNNSYDGLTFFAPTDAAFARRLRAGALNALSDQQQVQLLLYHVLPRYYSLATFQTASNPLRTEASGPGGAYAVNVTATTQNSLVNVSTGLVDVPLGSTMLAKFPLAVYSVDEVLLPEQMFGNQAGSSVAPAPAPARQPGTKATGRKKGGAAEPKSDVAGEPSAAGTEEDDEAESSNAAAGLVGNVEWSLFAALALIMAVVNIAAP